MGKKSNKQLRRDCGVNRYLDDIDRLRELYVVKEDDKYERKGRDRELNKSNWKK